MITSTHLSAGRSTYGSFSVSLRKRTSSSLERWPRCGQVLSSLLTFSHIQLCQQLYHYLKKVFSQFNLPSSHFLLKRLCTKAFRHGRCCKNTSRQPPVPPLTPPKGGEPQKLLNIRLMTDLAPLLSEGQGEALVREVWREVKGRYDGRLVIL